MNVTRPTTVEVDGRTYILTPHGHKGVVRIYEKRPDGSVRRVPRTIAESVLQEVYLRVFDRERPL